MKKYKQYWIDKFEAFLKENNCYEEFEKEIIKQRKYKSIKQCLETDFNDKDIWIFVSATFVWRAPNIEFFIELNKKWIEICENDL